MRTTLLLAIAALLLTACIGCTGHRTIDEITDHGEIITLDDGSEWQVEHERKADAEDWEPDDEVVIVTDKLGVILMVNVSLDNEQVTVSKIADGDPSNAARDKEIADRLKKLGETDPTLLTAQSKVADAKKTLTDDQKALEAQKQQLIDAARKATGQSP